MYLWLIQPTIPKTYFSDLGGPAKGGIGLAFASLRGALRGLQVWASLSIQATHELDTAPVITFPDLQYACQSFTRIPGSSPPVFCNGCFPERKTGWNAGKRLLFITDVCFKSYGRVV
jgi:hypothetical protein